MTARPVRLFVYVRAMALACIGLAPRADAQEMAPRANAQEMAPRANAQDMAPRPTLATVVPSVVSGHGAAFVAAPSADQVMHLVVSLPLPDRPALERFVAAVADPASPAFRHYVSVADFTARFGPSQADYAALVGFFRAQGLTVGPLAANRALIDVDGRVADVERVFNVRMGLYRHPVEHRLFLSPDRAPSLALAVPVQQVLGLDDYERPHAKYVRGPDTAGRALSGSGPKGNFTGADLRTVYYPTGKLTGRGQSVGLMELEGYDVADVNAFFVRNYGAANHVRIVGIQTDSEPLLCTDTCDDGEQALDIEYTISLAPGLDSVRVYVGRSPENVLNAMATDNISKVLSTSWGWPPNFATDHQLFLEFAAQGQTNLSASGDYSSLKASGPWPEEDDAIVAVGGTDVKAAGPGGDWAHETGWKYSAGGPSVDVHIAIEPYQAPFITAANGGSSTLRNVPDISANANFDMELCADGGCFGGVGGTSFASPILAGVIAMANEQAVAAGKPVVGFINPAIYKLALGHYHALFHDQTSGVSGLFSCMAGYDLVTGLGSPKGQEFIDALVGSGSF